MTTVTAMTPLAALAALAFAVVAVVAARHSLADFGHASRVCLATASASFRPSVRALDAI
jgi:hypothetical protein